MYHGSLSCVCVCVCVGKGNEGMSKSGGRWEVWLPLLLMSAIVLVGLAGWLADFAMRWSVTVRAVTAVLRTIPSSLFYSVQGGSIFACGMDKVGRVGLSFADAIFLFLPGPFCCAPPNLFWQKT